MRRLLMFQLLASLINCGVKLVSAPSTNVPLVMVYLWTPLMIPVRKARRRSVVWRPMVILITRR